MTRALTIAHSPDGMVPVLPCWRALELLVGQLGVAVHEAGDVEDPVPLGVDGGSERLGTGGGVGHMTMMSLLTCGTSAGPR
jgi:hypothetical protein